MEVTVTMKLSICWCQICARVTASSSSADAKASTTEVLAGPGTGDITANEKPHPRLSHWYGNSFHRCLLGASKVLCGNVCIYWYEEILRILHLEGMFAVLRNMQKQQN